MLIAALLIIQSYKQEEQLIQAYNSHDWSKWLKLLPPDIREKALAENPELRAFT